MTSPPYWGLRDYNHPAQYGTEPTLDTYIQHLRDTFAQARRVLADQGTLWLNLGDRYAANSDGFRSGPGYGRQPRIRPAAPLPPKNLIGLPWRVASALQGDGWILRNAIVWHKPNAATRPVADRFSCHHELLFLLVTQRWYYFDPRPGPAHPAPGAAAAPNLAAEQGRAYAATNDGPPRGTATARTSAPLPQNHHPGDVWTIPTRAQAASVTSFPIDVPLRAIAAGCHPGGTVLDPFAGSGTTVQAAHALNRSAIGIELQPHLADQMITRVEKESR
ncbi:DNA-methyltransferase [Nocardiopsis nanhaiensis]